jgi:hypothetical protein
VGFKLGQAQRDRDRDFPLRDPRINISLKTLRRMTRSAYVSGYASKPVEDMAEELNAAPEAIRRSRKRLVRFGLFTRPQRWRYQRILLPGETRKAHWRRMRTLPYIDMAARCLWVLCDATRSDGDDEAVPLSLAMLAANLGTTAQHAARALGQALELGYFDVERGGGRSNWNVYQRSSAWDAIPQLQQEIIGYEQEEETREAFDYKAAYRQRFPERTR